MSSSTAALPTDRNFAAARGIVVAAGVAAAIGCAGYISTIFLLSDPTVRDAARAPLTITASLVVAISFAVLAAGLPTLVNGLRLPRWAGVVAGAGCALVAANAWGTGTLAVPAASLLTDAQMTHESVWFTLLQAGQSLPCAVGFLALAVAGLRRRAFSRGAGVLLLVAGVVSLLPAYPPGALLAALAVVWIAGSARDTGTTAS